jgi:hypothetical protein
MTLKGKKRRTDHSLPIELFRFTARKEEEDKWANLLPRMIFRSSVSRPGFFQKMKVGKFL